MRLTSSSGPARGSITNHKIIFLLWEKYVFLNTTVFSQWLICCDTQSIRRWFLNIKTWFSLLPFMYICTVCCWLSVAERICTGLWCQVWATWVILLFFVCLFLGTDKKGKVQGRHHSDTNTDIRQTWCHIPDANTTFIFLTALNVLKWMFIDLWSISRKYLPLRLKLTDAYHLMINDSCVPVIQSIVSEYLIKTWLLAYTLARLILDERLTMVLDNKWVWRIQSWPKMFRKGLKCVFYVLHAVFICTRTNCSPTDTDVHHWSEIFSCREIELKCTHVKSYSSCLSYSKKPAQV